MSDPIARAVRGGVAGGALSTGLVALRFVTGFATQLVLIRLLLPHDYGQFAQVLLAVGLIGMLRSFHTGEFLIQYREADAGRAFDVLFTFELLQGLVVGAAGLLLASPLVRLAGGAGLERAVWLMLASFLILPFGFCGALLERQLDFRRALFPALCGTLVGPAIKIGLALLGWGMWSLLVGELARMLFEVGLLFALAPVRPRLAFDRALVGRGVRFGLPLTIAAGIAYWYWQFDDLVVGRLLGEAALGHYYVAFRIPRYLYQLREQLGRVSYPMLVRLDEQGRIGAGCETMMRYAAYLCGLPLVVVLVQGEGLVRVLFGAPWLPALLPLQILTGATALRVVAGLSGDVFKARGKTSVFLLFNTMNALLLTALVIPLTRRFGIAGAAAAVLLTLLPSSLLALFLLRRLVPLRIGAALWRPVLLAAGLTLAGLKLGLPSPADPIRLALQLVAACGIYGALAWLIDPRIASELRWLRSSSGRV